MIIGHIFFRNEEPGAKDQKPKFPEELHSADLPERNEASIAKSYGNKEVSPLRTLTSLYSREVVLSNVIGV